MDNVTHALAGMIVAEAVVLALTPRGQEPSAVFRRRAWTASAIANNFPDLDFVYRGITPGKIGYLLHHRGHTHTLLLGLLLGLSTYALVRFLPKDRGRALERAELRALFALSLFGPLLHIGMDFSNNYGVHPFWPFDDRWLYGDAVFIIEPWFWVLLVPPLFFATRSRWLRGLLGLVSATGVALAWLTDFAGLLTALALTLSTLVWFWLCRRSPLTTRAAVALGGSAAVACLFFACAALARSSVTAAQRSAGATLVDAVITPAPANPLCFSAYVVRERAARYELHTATVALLPSLLPPSRCNLEPTGASLGMGPPTLQSSDAVRWEGTWSAPLSELRRLSREHCEVLAFLRYARVPFWLERGPHLYLGDLRYDREPEPGFTEYEVPREPGTCPPWVPEWRPPRHEILLAP